MIRNAGSNASDINLSFVVFEIEKLFEYSNDDVGCLSKWYFGEVFEIVSEKTRSVRNKWNESCLCDGGETETVDSYFRQNGIHSW
jgi:hypothetical protein